MTVTDSASDLSPELGKELGIRIVPVIVTFGSESFKAGEEIYAPHRERAVLERVVRKNKGPITHDSLRAIYREVMSSALSLEKTLTMMDDDFKRLEAR